MEGLSKKHMKKWKSILSKLLADGLQAGTEPSKTLAVGNGGIHNGVCPTKLLELLNTYGEVDKFSVIPKKSYVVITYTSVESAESIFKNVQGTDIKKSDGGPNATLYFYYLNTKINPDSQQKAVHTKPQGLHIQEDFITEKEEKQLIDSIEKDLIKQSKQCSQSVLKHRQVLHYGYKFQYGTNDVDLNDPMAKEDMPEHVSNVIEKVMETELWEAKPDQCTVNKYEPGHGIPFHVDNPEAFTTSISSLSLGSSIMFEMRHPIGSVFNVLLKPRSLLTLTGEARYEWTHGIKPKKTDIVHDSTTNSEAIIHRGVRWSLTLRKVKDKTSEKEGRNGPPTVDTQDAVEIEKRHVHGVYNKIASHFASTREKPWPKVVEFLRSLSSNSLVLDIGCGSGRYLRTEDTNHFIFGCDRSSSLIDICEEKHPFVFVSDGLNVPMKSDFFDACICIAVIHHYFTAERRLSAIKEIVRLLRKGGRALIQVWAAEQVYKNKHSAYLNKQSVNSSTDLLVENLETLKVECAGDQEQKVCSLPIHKNRNHFAQQDMFVPWKLKNSPTQAPTNTHYRFYHVFKEGELDQLCSSIDNCTLEKSYYDNGNWAAIITKDL